MTKKITHEFVKAIPTPLKEDVLYISIDYTTVIHKCFCGCGCEVNTPLSPTDWKLIFDGSTVSIYPSVGSWNLACKSHYWIENDEIRWAKKWSDEDIQLAGEEDKVVKKNYYAADPKKKIASSSSNSSPLFNIKKWMNWK